MASLLSQRISPALDSILSKEQAGFQPESSCADRINSLRMIIEQSAEFNTHLYLLLIDFERTFAQFREVQGGALLSKGITEKIQKLIRKLFRNAEVSVRFNGKESRPFGIVKGVK